ncbi:glucose/arabinose dehydrogenase/PKD repeat protein/type 1 glutamine amidotransferase [Nocardioides cavernae]|uniref:Glucose/arabinose dehydrogenase/PKD repeat protein/type 1 glutamine amidotransferase n=1 Tax=Nocardioides cavernae TaxID=1921566 RepID=A0A7Y9H1S6_9ACTN|nr:ThuA domain-containing protein [Nocardioides cavernae]NYE36076.1 glucose/arabinose dehydrogenase/PKD repeat protein/type 1 glutamine amidotransferase [Nocardioides cavernae]
MTALTAVFALVGSVLLGVATAMPAQAHEGHGHVLLYNEAPAGPWHDEAIAYGTPKIKAALEAEGLAVTVSSDSSVFTDENLAQYDAMIAFQINGDPWTAAEKGAMERWMQAGGGIAAIHNATDMRGNYPWWDNMIGALMPGHSAADIPAVVRNEDVTHPSTDHFAGTDKVSRWMRNDEWYNFNRNVRGEAHVLQTMDESTYNPGGNAQGYDHPITWCKPYDGGRFWSTALGHFPKNYDEPEFMEMIVGGVKYVAGLEEGDCGGTVWDSYERIPLDQNTSAPYAIDVADDGKVFYTELVRGQLRMYDPESQAVTTVLTLPVYSGGEDGLLGVALDPDFTTNGHLYLYRSAASPNDSDPANFWSTVSRFTFENGSVDPATEKVIIRIPARRLPDEPGHTGGALDIDDDGNLFIGVGDDVNPHSEPSGGYAPLSERAGTFHDARETSANTNDLRGKILRIVPVDEPGNQPGVGSTYTIPDGNLFDEADDADGKTLPEIYAMGFRNPFRFSIDSETGWLSMADYSPDNGSDNPANRGPAGIAEWNLIKSPGNYGWPMCMGGNHQGQNPNGEPFRDVDYGSTTPLNPPVVGAYFDCANPVNDSVRNTGLKNLPPARAADMYYGYQRSSTGAIPAGGGLAPMGGPIYRYDEALESDTKFPESFDGKPFFYDWARNKMYNIQLKDPATAQGSQVEKVNPFLPNVPFLAPIDSKFGPDGSMYVLDWGGGYGRDNPTSGLYRIDYISGSRSPVARIDATPDSGQAPLEVSFDASRSSDPEGEDITYEWDFDGDGEVDATGVTATHTYTENGEYDARLTVTDPAGKTGTTTTPITVGNTRPIVEIETPPDGAFFDFGDEISWQVKVTDPEDTTIDPQGVEVQPALGHDDHAHPLVAQKGLTGSEVTSIGGHAADENIFYAIDARYTDTGGEGGANKLLGSDTAVIFPKLRQAEWFDGKSSTATLAPGRDAAGGGQVVVGKDGAWVNFEPVSFHQIETFNLRVQAAAAGGTIELRDGSPTGDVLGTATVPATGQQFRDVAVDVSELGSESFDLYLVFTGSSDIKLNFFEAMGQGISPEAKPLVAITAPVDGTRVDAGDEVEVTAEASDLDGTVAKVEFFQGETKIGEDTSAPFSTTWTAPEEEGLYEITAKATDDEGKTTTSRLVQVQVGELFGDLVPFSNASGEFERLGAGAFRISGAGANAWQGTDQYSTLFQPAAGDEEYDAIVRVDASTLQNNSGKAGLIIRNDMTQPGSSAGYAMLAWRRASGMEFLTDPDGNGQLNASVAGGTSTTPKWLKLSRRGEQVSAYWSNNGTSWTQIGAAVTLSGIADTQDVGMFIMAHESAVRTADFSQFSVGDPEVVEPEPGTPSEPLSCVGGPLSDDFTSPALLPKWALRHDPARPITQSGGSLNLPVTGGDINEASPGPVSFAGQDLPAGNWVATTKLTLAHTSHWQWAGLVVHKSDDEYNKLAFVRHQDGGRLVEFQSETGGNRSTPGAPRLAADFPTTIHLRLTNTNGTLTAAYSTNGTAWTNVTGSTALKTGAGTRIGLMAAGDLGTTPVSATVDSFTVTPDGTAGTFEPGDEFDGTSLNGCRWAESVRYNSRTASVAGGHLKIETEPGDINGNNPITPRNFILQDAPDGDWVAETKFKAPLKHRYQLAGLLMYGDDNNYAKADIVAFNTPGSALDLRAELAAEKGGNGVSGGDQVNIADTSESGYWWVQVTKVGTKYTAAVKSTAGASWTPIGDGITYDGPLNSLGLMAIGPEQEEPTTVEFDYFRLDTGEEPPVDETAPVTTASQVAVEGGVQVTLTATDETGGSGLDSTEYRIDEGDWTPYTAPFTISEPGTHTVEFRSTDLAGNEEATKSVQVVVEASDEDAPTTAITWVPGTADGEEGWYVTGPSFTLAAEDGDGSGVATTEYRINGGAWTAYTGAVAVPDGEHTVAYRSTDEAGNVEDSQESEVKVDTVTPATGATQEKAGDGVKVVLDATDATSGVASTEYRVDGGSWTAYTAPVVVTGAGDHVVRFRSTDVAGNVEEEQSIDLTVDGPPADTTAPVTTVKTDPASPDGTAGWFTTAPKVTLTATDQGSGVARTEYRTGNGMWTTYTAPFTLTTQGRNALEVRSVDRAGNVETAQAKEVALDTGDPALSISGIRARTYPSHKSATVAWAATDATSGVRTVRATLDGEVVEAGEWGMWMLSTGRHVLTVTATDAAGNSASETVVFTVQATGKSLKKVVGALAESGEVGPKLANKLLQLEKDAAKAERKGDVREARKHLKALRKLVRKKLDGELRAALLAQVKERLAKR